ncbi:hypothetical protein IG611_01690 [Pectobacterium sp. A535-S3-A17]|uniref:hypothetical protein n=1 Tax=Pectobacterium quasiaquaticum TaxID=2774015 RepID=UPI001873C49B|nr:hypothetical protein [Pectobacterium quasiaquaticum]MBE5213252.1 hypothetical protein [Pectobacterium quasiaquaticum]MBE5224098.1 hypothetical protein [Pectobacterium quasiaquaticum]
MKPEMSTAVMIERVRALAPESQDGALLNQVANRIELLLESESVMSREMACIRHALDIPPDQSVQSGVVDAFVRMNAEILGLSQCREAAEKPVITDNERQQLRAEGIIFAANRLLAAWDAGFIDKHASDTLDVATMILSAMDMLPDATEGDCKRNFAEEMLRFLRDEAKKEPTPSALPVVPDERQSTLLFDEWFNAIEAGDDEDWQEPRYLSKEWNEYIARMQLARGAWNAAMLQSGNPVWSGIDWAKGCEPTQAVPEGWALVPLNANIAMIRVGGAAARKHLEETGGNSPQVIYQAMLAAAPQLERKDGEA